MKLADFWHLVGEYQFDTDAYIGRAMTEVLREQNVPGFETIKGTRSAPSTIKSNFFAKRWVSEHVAVDCVGTILEVHP